MSHYRCMEYLRNVQNQIQMVLENPLNSPRGSASHADMSLLGRSRISKVRQNMCELAQDRYYQTWQDPIWLTVQIDGSLQMARARRHAGYSLNIMRAEMKTRLLSISRWPRPRKVLGFEQSINSKTSYVDFFRTAPYRKRSLDYRNYRLLCRMDWQRSGLVLFGVDTSYHWNHGNQGPDTVSFQSPIRGLDLMRYLLSENRINGCLHIFIFICAISAGTFIGRIGRRRLWLTSAIGMLPFFIAWTILNSNFSAIEDPEIEKAVLAFVFLFSLFFNIGFYSLKFAYPIEIWP